MKIKNKKDIEIQKYLVVSTAHITATENQDLVVALDTTYPLSVYSDEYTHVIYVPPKLSDCKDDVGENIINLLKIAKKHGCCYLKLDRDGPVYSDLLKFNW